MNQPPFVIAIDGPTASGKGTLARGLAARYGFDWLDSGLLYRRVALSVLDAGAEAGDEAEAARQAQSMHHPNLADPRLRLETTGGAASQVAAMPGVRAALLDFQRGFAAHPPSGKGAVIDGRDIGTVVCPDAAVKLFVTAEVEIRAERRFRELQGKGIGVTYAAVLEDLKQRDARDTQRAASPLRQAADAVMLDVTHLDAAQALATALDIVGRVIA